MILKPFYADYVNHMLRFYVRNPICMTQKTPEVANYLAVMAIFRTLTDQEQGMLTAVYSEQGNLAEIIRAYCKQTKTPPKVVWGLVNRVTKLVAQERGLV